MLALALTAASGAAAALAAAAPSPTSPAPGARGAAREAVAAASGANVYLDEPPATAYDRLGEGRGIALAPESLGLLAQLGRTVLALAATLAIIYLFFKLLWPRLVARVASPSQQQLQLVERLALDGKNSLLMVAHRDGRRYLLACGEHGCVVVDREAAPDGGPTAGPKARPASGAPFGEVLRTTAADATSTPT